MATTYARQSVTVPQVMDAVALLARKALGWAAGRVIEWHYQGRPNLDAGRSVVWFRLVVRGPDAESGAGRYGTKAPAKVSLNLATRGFLDGSDKDHRIQRDHWTNQFLLENAFYGQMLHDLYADRVGDEPPKPPTDGTASLLSIGTMVMSEVPAPEKTRPEQGWIETNLTFDIPCVLKLSLASVPALDTPSFGG